MPPSGEGATASPYGRPVSRVRVAPPRTNPWSDQQAALAEEPFRGSSTRTRCFGFSAEASSPGASFFSSGAFGG